MTSVREESPGIRLEWASSVRNVQQAVVGDLLSGDLFGLERAVRRLKEDVPVPANVAESLLLRQGLALFADRCARQLHERFHASTEKRGCSLSPPLEQEAHWLLPDRPIGELLDAWMTGYVTWFGDHHNVPVVWRATKILRGRAAESWAAAILARETGCCRTTLLQEFDHDIGMSPTEYIARLRIRQGLRHLCTTTDTVEGASIHAGYRSCSKFYRRVFHYTGTTPAAMRALQPAALDRLLDERLPLTMPRGVSRRKQRVLPMTS